MDSRILVRHSSGMASMIQTMQKQISDRAYGRYFSRSCGDDLLKETVARTIAQYRLRHRELALNAERWAFNLQFAVYFV